MSSMQSPNPNLGSMKSASDSQARSNGGKIDDVFGGKMAKAGASSGVEKLRAVRSAKSAKSAPSRASGFYPYEFK